ncbi:MAG: dTMP kinase [Nanoarchaeota archaeon]|nr:dTMP kinase [Nanoarchaeota archaeon]
MEKERGKFIVFEGIDGCGKGTQIKAFNNYLFDISKYNNTLLTREPYQSREIRRIMQEDKDAYSRPEKCAELFIEDRKNHLRDLIIPNLEQGIIVLSDRYKYSTIAYQSSQGMNIDFLIQSHNDMLIPDLTLIFDVPVEVASSRILERIEHDKNEKEKKFESDKIFSEKLRQVYLKLPELLRGEDIRIVNANRNIEDITGEIIGIYNLKFG